MLDREAVHISGEIESVVFQNHGNGYAVLRVSVSDGGELTVVGGFPFAGAGEHIEVEGAFFHHPTYGEQLRAVRAERTLPKEVAGVEKYLKSGGVKGIGPVTGVRIAELFQGRSFEIIANFPEKLSEIPGITRRKAEQISKEFKEQMSLRRLLEYLSEYEVSAHVALKLHQWYGGQALDFVRENPYLLSEAEVGVDFGVCDDMAAEIGMERASPQRVEAGVLFELTHNLGNGHVFLPEDKLCEAAARFLDVEATAVALAVSRLLERERIARYTLAGKPVIYLARIFEDETFAAEKLREMASLKSHPPGGTEKLLSELESDLGISYAEKQREAIRMAAEGRIMLLTGGPGTGKTTSVRGMLALFDRLKLTPALAAPTGRAAKRLSELCGREAATIHRLLGVKFTEESPGYSFLHDEKDPIPAEAVVLDEVSMVDIQLFAAFLRALKPGAKLVLVGDPDQLPSVGPGNVLRDILRSGVVPTVRLSEIFRQASQSNIVTGAHKVNQGEMPELKHKSGDFYFVKKTDPLELVETVRGLCHTRLPKNMNIPVSDIQVLTPTRKGPAGSVNLNHILQESLNPPMEGKPEKQAFGKLFRLGDRVMHIRNNYDLPYRNVSGGEGLGVFNGDIGVICGLDPRAEVLTVLYDDRLVDYPFELLEELELAYAMTIHKAQGSEYRAVVLALADAAPRLLARPVLYTAMTRASELLVAVGSEERFSEMVANDRKLKRFSGLKFRLLEENM